MAGIMACNVDEEIALLVIEKPNTSSCITGSLPIGNICGEAELNEETPGWIAGRKSWLLFCLSETRMFNNRIYNKVQCIIMVNGLSKFQNFYIKIFTS